MAQWEPEFYLITFSSANHCIAAEKQVGSDKKAFIIPTPRELTASCGMALRFDAGAQTKEQVRDFFAKLDVPAVLYAAGFREKSGKRTFKVLTASLKTE